MAVLYLNDMEPLLTIREVCALLKKSDQVVKRLWREGKIPTIKIGNTWRFQAGEIEKWVKGEKPKNNDL